MHYQPQPDLLKNRILLITGANDGIGRQAAITYAQYGAQVILLARTTEKLIAVRNEIEDGGGKVLGCYGLDFEQATATQCQTLVRQIEQITPYLDGVLHNAGILGEVKPMIEQTPEIWAQVMQVNVNATFYLTQALLPLLLNADVSSLIFTSSSVGREGRANWGAYAVSKFATEGMMQVLAAEYKTQRLRVNCINPGGTRSKMRAGAFPEENPQLLKTPADIMPLYLWLMGDDSRHETGKTFDAQPHRKPGAANE